MALINCVECKNVVSDKAPSCPNCGAPVSQSSHAALDPRSNVKVTRTGSKWEGIGTILVIIGMLGAIGPSDSSISAPFMLVGFIVFIIGRFL